MLLPGPEAQQLAIYTGWLLHGLRGGLIVALLALSAIYVSAGDTDLVTGLFTGLAPRRDRHRRPGGLPGRQTRPAPPAPIGLAVASFLALTVFWIPFPIVVISAGVVGWLLSLIVPQLAETPAGRSRRAAQLQA